MIFTKTTLTVATVAGLFLIGATVRTAIAVGQTTNTSAPTTAPAVSPASPKVIAGATEATKLLLLMDADKNGKVSRAEFMAFMAAEFERLDTNHDGQLDVKELERSQLVSVHHGGTHR
jgi:hypothetical protein